ncbi:MAG: hypothetical protein Q4E49_01445, partial [Bacteroidales bacterium]|nr:hypothetical protein [Bacteroidales bacterium]
KASRRLSLAVGEAGANIQGKSESEAAKKLQEIYQKFYDSEKICVICFICVNLRAAKRLIENFVLWGEGV